LSVIEGVPGLDSPGHPGLDWSPDDRRSMGLGKRREIGVPASGNSSKPMSKLVSEWL
jgi:hypothetical protein